MSEEISAEDKEVDLFKLMLETADDDDDAQNEGTKAGAGDDADALLVATGDGGDGDGAEKGNLSPLPYFPSVRANDMAPDLPKVDTEGHIICFSSFTRPFTLQLPLQLPHQRERH